MSAHSHPASQPNGHPAASSASAQPADVLTVPTTAGYVRGIYEQLEDGSRVRSWRGVYFGDTTAGPARFQAARPVPPWAGVRDASEFGPVAPQPTYSWTERVEGSEDCLHLDIVRPDTDRTLPVVVYLHGGSYIVGSSHMFMLRGFNMARDLDVVYVSVNFRLGALGYLDVRSLAGQACANPALSDQLLALHWVRDNIAAFGGDPQAVTVMGESAGGAAVLTLMASPAAQGLFHRAIAQSPPISLVHSRAQSTLWARELVNRLALPRMSTVRDLQDQDFADIVRAGQSMMWRKQELLHLNSCYAPTVDRQLLPEHPIDVFESGTQAPVPLLIGTNADEASFAKFLFQRARARRRAGVRLLSSFDSAAAEEVVAQYNGAHSRSDFAQLLADALFWAPAVAVAEAHAVHHPTWMYSFEFAPVVLRALGLGAVHSLELSHLFGDAQASRISVLTRMGSAADFAGVTQTMQQHWRQFIHAGDPGPQWPAYRVFHSGDPAQRLEAARDNSGADVGLRAVRRFDVESSVVCDPKADKRLAWQDYNMRQWGAGRPELVEALDFITSLLD
ncbi:carboxylesterase/lipase family protein [Corynebacterium lizhenjunii]|uniref:Carboxylic ester hydrolase n=1 Tax=Corynebacterium lizhenjunii TaxID=2709394 RepID=A0A7T0KGX2_9CORY|nr:carboxylesterase/lipase family protein [Corynebacterium lizhenjunii]QPK79944.1 carboxylesterase/lipase family protein [Corynebacterium lizhenjunii]